MKINVIKMNDAVVATVSGNEEKVNKHLDGLAKDYYDKYNNTLGFDNYKDYRENIFWHTVEKQLTIL